MEINLSDLRGLLSGIGSESAETAYSVGDVVLIRTVTFYYTGRVSAVFDNELCLEDAAWIADTGRFSTALKTGELSEVEPYELGVVINRASIIDVSPWAHPLPRSVK